MMKLSTLHIEGGIRTNWLLGYVFNDPKIALINFKPDYYDLILLDVKMPEMKKKPG
jgi:CheY-like chemotaxis protein